MVDKTGSAFGRRDVFVVVSLSEREKDAIKFASNLDQKASEGRAQAMLLSPAMRYRLEDWMGWMSKRV